MARLNIVVSSLMPVFAGDMILQRAQSGGGYARMECPHDGLYVNADTPVISVDDAEEIISHIREERARELVPKPSNGNGHPKQSFFANALLRAFGQ